MDLWRRFQSMNLDWSSLGLEKGDLSEPFFCWPLEAEPIGFEGCVLYCFLPQYGQTVFAANPESCAGSYVYPLAAGFEDFLRLLLACGSANPAEQIIWMSRRQFEQHLRQEGENQTPERRQALALLRREFQLEPMEDPFASVKALQAGFDGGKIRYRPEYYQALGLEEP